MYSVMAEKTATIHTPFAVKTVQKRYLIIPKGWINNTDNFYPYLEDMQLETKNCITVMCWLHLAKSTHAAGL